MLSIQKSKKKKKSSGFKIFELKNESTSTSLRKRKLVGTNKNPSCPIRGGEQAPHGSV